MIYVLDSALKHGFTEEELKTAWGNAFQVVRCRAEKQPPHYMALGLTSSNQLVEMIAFSNGLDWFIFHAHKPPTAGFKKEYRESGGTI